jgi:hypothetical protein
MPTLQFKGKNIIWNHHLAVPFHTLAEIALGIIVAFKNLVRSKEL